MSSDCGALDLRPASRKFGYNLTSTGTSSWGSKIIHDPHNAKLFHLFLAEFTDDYRLDYWSSYSRIIRAESATGPPGPYTFAQEVVGAFAHSPTVIFSPADKSTCFTISDVHNLRRIHARVLALAAGQEITLTARAVFRFNSHSISRPGRLKDRFSRAQMTTRGMRTSRISHHSPLLGSWRCK